MASCGIWRVGAVAAALGVGGLGWAAEPLESHEARASTALSMPMGCWDVLGHARWDWREDSGHRSFGDAVLRARSEGGTWTAWEVLQLGDGGRDPTVPPAERDDTFALLTGAPSEGAGTLNQLLGELSREVETIWLDRADEGPVLVRTLASPKGAVAEQRVGFDGDGEPVAWSLTLPRGRYRTERGRVQVRALSAQVAFQRLDDGEVVPRTEAIQLDLRTRGLRIFGYQQVEFRAFARCPADGSFGVDPAVHPAGWLPILPR